MTRFLYTIYSGLGSYPWGHIYILCIYILHPIARLSVHYLHISIPHCTQTYMFSTYPHISYIIHYTVPSYHRYIHTYRVRIRVKGITLLYYIKMCIPLIWYMSFIYLVCLMILIPYILSCIATTISLE
jgi:hypothetical protein